MESFSIYIQKNPDIPSRKKITWVNDESIENCYKCDILFTWYNRKHHCRYCGRIFCNKCCNKWVNCTKLNEYKLIDILYITDDFNDEPYRVCKECNILIKKMKNIVCTIKTLENNDSTIIDIKKSLTQESNNMMIDTYNIYLSNFREIQYKLPNNRLTVKEKNLLVNNLNLIIGHNKYICQYLKNINNPDIIEILNSKQKNYSCFDLMCTRGCSSKLLDSDVIDILFHKKDSTIRKYVLQFLTNDEKKIVCYIPILTYTIKYCPDGLIKKYLITKSLQYTNIRYEFFWELIVLMEESNDCIYKQVYEELLNNIETILGIQELNKLLAGKNFFLSINNCNASNIRKKIMANSAYNIRPFPIPLNPNFSLHNIIFQNITEKNSNSKPIVLPIQTKNLHNYNMLYKSEDIRKDKIISNVIKYMDIILKEEGLDLELITYNVLPTTKHSGFIEMVDNSETIYNIEHKHKYTILNYIMEKNLDKTIEEIREKFCKSLAGYCIITYLLGIGDRHLNNIMITDDAKLFHIDYSFLLGKDPKSILASQIKITEGMVNTLGGRNSIYYKKFQNYCSSCYEILRKHTNIFINMLSLLTIVDTKITMHSLEKEIGSRFQPAENSAQAEIQIIKMINNSQHNNIMVDRLHNLGQWISSNII